MLPFGGQSDWRFVLNGINRLRRNVRNSAIPYIPLGFHAGGKNISRETLFFRRTGRLLRTEGPETISPESIGKGDKWQRRW